MSKQANNGSVEEEAQTEWEYRQFGIRRSELNQVLPGEQVYDLKLTIVRHQPPGVLDRVLATPLNEIPTDVSSFSSHNFYTSM